MNERITMTMKRLIPGALFAAALAGAGFAHAQSHSVTNMANPPQAQSDSKPATEATPGHTATADAQDARHAGKGARDAKANKGKAASKPAKAERPKGGKTEAARDISSSAGNEAKETMQRDPSEAQMGDMERHAFDSAPAKK
jgi:hypothetical protein